MTEEHAEALDLAAREAVTLGMALARFEGALERLRAVTPKCACGWASGHRGPHRRVVVA